MQSNLSCNSFSKFLNRVINVVLNGFDEKSVTMWVIYIHKISGFFQVNTTPLISMDHYD